jgi:prophage DNA circulation protein
MSDFTSSAGVGLFGDWRQNLQPGSFRGIPFLCRDVSNPAGQRLAKFEFPDSDQPQVQPLGRGIKTWRLQLYVAGDDYMDQRDALEQALDQDGPGTLVHPYRGQLQVYAEFPCPIKELSEKGRAAFFECNFVEEGGPAQPTPSPDTASIAFDAADDVFSQLADAFNGGLYAFDGAFAFVQAATELMFTAVQTALGVVLTAEAGVLSVAQDIVTLAAVAYDDTVGYAEVLTGLFQDYVVAIVTAANVIVSTVDPTAPPGYQDSSRLPELPTDPSYGLGAIAGGAITLAPASATGQLATNATALGQLVQGAH